MPTLKLLVGPPASGKSTYSNALADYVYINQDSQGKEQHLKNFYHSILNGDNIVVDRMNFNKEQRQRYILPAKEEGYNIEIVQFFKSRKSCIEGCLKRPDHETIKDKETAERAVNFFFANYERPTADEGKLIVAGDTVMLTKPRAIVVDLDGTLCNIDHRLRHVRGPGKKNWMAFFAGIKDDKLNMWCYELISALKNRFDIVFCSGRGEEYRDVTQKWLDDKGLSGFSLFMRPAKDHRSDDVVKEILLDFDILTQYTPLFFIDDRQRVVNMWRRRGFTCLQCAPGDF